MLPPRPPTPQPRRRLEQDIEIPDSDDEMTKLPSIWSDEHTMTLYMEDETILTDVNGDCIGVLVESESNICESE